ncbi:MAG: tetratricopeptide repeat protein [Polyangiaceae bacterium]
MSRTSKQARALEPPPSGEESEAEPRKRRALAAPALLVLGLIAVYAPSLGGGFLNLDDPWLIDRNPVFRTPTWAGLVAIWTDFSMPGRLNVGAEYLPLRDTSVWLEGLVDGLSPLVMRSVNLAVYAAAVLLLRAALRRALGARPSVELITALFAFHPLHVESVAWLAERKDVLALLFSAGALFVHMGRARHRDRLTALLVLCACLSKAQSVVVVGLLLAFDVLAQRPLKLANYAAPTAVAAICALLHAWVGHVVHMTTALAGGTRAHAAFMLGEIIARYLDSLVWPAHLSIYYDTPSRIALTPLGFWGYALLSAWGIAALYYFRRGGRSAGHLLAAWLCFWVPLLPVSQVLFPLQNRMADRYQMFSVLALGLLAAWAVEQALARLRNREAAPRANDERWLCLAFVPLLCWFALASARRAWRFADSARLFADATQKTERNLLAPYMWASALEENGDATGAESAYLETLRRTRRSEDAGRRATNNLARLYARQGRLTETQALLVRGRARWPDDPKLLSNLSVVEGRLGHAALAASLAQELRQRFPEFHSGQRSLSDLYTGP